LQNIRNEKIKLVEHKYNKLFQVFDRKSRRKGDPGIDGTDGRTILK
jgi:hypothetical protein